jgi:hypothetical protein
VLEDISSSPWPEETDHSVVLDILGAIDAAPVAHRAELGRVILAWLDEMLHAPADEVRWRFRRLMFPDRPHLIFGAASRFDAMVQEAFGSLVSLRHQQHLEVLPERKDVRTVGILLTPRRDGRRPWDTTLAATRGEQGLEGDLRTSLEKMWGPFNTHLHPGGQSLRRWPCAMWTYRPVVTVDRTHFESPRQPEPSALVLNEPNCYHFRALDPAS